MQLQDIEIVSIRPTQYGGQNSTVVLNKQWANELCKRGTIRIGWTPRHVRQRINITRCYRCLEFGHHKWECKGKDNTATCLKCENSDHRAKECTGESYCLICRKNGHRADRTRCPYYRKLIHEKTKELANEKGRRKDSTKTNSEKRQARLRSNSGRTYALHDMAYATAKQHDIQINVGRTYALHDMAYATAKQHDMDILFVCEPNKKRVKDTNWIKDTRTDVAALILTKNVEVIGHSAGDGHLVLELETCDIVCCYVSPNIEMHQYELKVVNIMIYLLAFHTLRRASMLMMHRFW
ncbi:hypothetical protein QE152_g22195 [Popillia japonica]|uniref:CCHC-type domain-containing protein n=1 Tax=Popillia japonica TaxID=7064 RepID=A0AAW1KL04_POPJA